MTPLPENLDFQVRKDDFHTTRGVESPTPGRPQPGQVIMRVDSFALTANNITYAAYGDALGYWQFYPAEEGWGRIPVWGYADVVASAHPDVEVGERLFGYWPMSRYALLAPAHVDGATVIEGAASRQTLNRFYNRYVRCALDTDYRAEEEDWRSLLQPLGLTGFLLDTFLAEHDFWGAGTVILSSASSKTSYSLAYFLHRRGGCEVVGLTSASNLDYVRDLGCYDHVLEYAEIEPGLANVSSVFVDMAGDAEVLARIHEHLNTDLCKSITVGGTHWQALGAPESLLGPAPEFFFAPSHIEERIQDWGPEEFQQRFAAAWSQLLPSMQGGISLVHGEGVEALEDIYRAMLDGTAAADKGYIISL